MSFEVPADAYGRFMGRFSEPLAALFADAAGVRSGRVLDVGCGPGALTRELVARGAEVAAVDPSEPFVAAAQQAFPEVDVRVAPADRLPYDDGTFDAALAQLVVSFMPDPVAGLAEMARVTRPGGVVAACVWDHGGGRGPVSPFWRAVLEVAPDAPGDGALPGTAQHQIEEYAERAGLVDVVESDLAVGHTFASFEEWWEPYTLGVSVAGDYVGGLDVERRDALREGCRQRMPTAPFTIDAHAWCVVAHKQAD